MKKYEVEVKYRVADFERLETRLSELGAVPLPENYQCDTYFQHPARNFAETDEALRIRQSTDGLFVTCKGPKIDAETKTRHEIEFSIGESDADKTQFAELLDALDFAVVADVEKRRREFKLMRDGQLYKIALDTVNKAGCFVELETECTGSELAAGQEAIKHLAEQLNLTDSIRTSYLEMILNPDV
ncbi:MAG: class IV adenylate cyclase [Verrucomicrobiales bacterium]|nr:class IV adenylate cyclase [Verrucomicrobiales bacterium]